MLCDRYKSLCINTGLDGDPLSVTGNQTETLLFILDVYYASRVYFHKPELESVTLSLFCSLVQHFRFTFYVFRTFGQIRLFTGEGEYRPNTWEENHLLTLLQQSQLEIGQNRFVKRIVERF